MSLRCLGKALTESNIKQKSLTWKDLETRSALPKRIINGELLIRRMTYKMIRESTRTWTTQSMSADPLLVLASEPVSDSRSGGGIST